MADVNTWLANIDLVRSNPASIQRIALDALEELKGSRVNIVDASNPFVFLLEASSINASAAMIASEVQTRKQYPTMAVTEDDLYLHMSDREYVGRFASPSRATFKIHINKEELLARAVPTGENRVKKITIPRDTEFTIADCNFTMQYPIDIKVMSHGGIQVVYDTSQISPLETLDTNIVTYSTVRIREREYLLIEIPTSQMTVVRKNGSLDLTVGFTARYEFEDQFYFARVYYSKPDGSWHEFITTHTQQVFDPRTPTAVLKVYSNMLEVSIPQIYLTTEEVSEDVRVDIYTTKGPLDMILSNYDINNFTVRWRDLSDDVLTSRYSAPLTVFNEMGIFSDSTVSGGTNSLTFEALRRRVMINATGSPSIPITPAQIVSRLEDLGYSLVKDVDNITNRQYLATRLLPKPKDGSSVAGCGSTIQTLIASMEDLTAFRTVIDNDQRITITPETLFTYDNGLVSIVPDATIDSLLAYTPDVRVRHVNDGHYLYTPFHYVLDMTDNRFDHRAYYLDSPVIETKAFIGENDTLGIEVGTRNFKIDRVAEGYKITIVTQSGDVWKNLDDADVHCQMSFTPSGENTKAYLNGTFIGRNGNNERLFEFIIGTNFDIDKFDNILITTFQMFDDEPRDHGASLLQDFDVTYAVSDPIPSDVRRSELDDDFQLLDLPLETMAIARERLRVRLGDALNGLWTQSRSVASSADYARHLVDVPAVYPYDIYERDPVTGVISFTIDGESIEYVVLHNAGDPMLDEEDNPLYSARAGDPVVDANGNPVIISSRKMVRQVDITFLDGAYWFATEVGAVAYERSIPNTITSWVRDDIDVIQTRLLEQTELFFYPMSTLGYINAVVLENETRNLLAEQSFAVTYYLTSNEYRDAALRKSLTRTALETIYQCLQSNVVTITDINSKLLAAVKDNVVAVEVTGLGGSSELAVATLVDDSSRFSIRKVARALPDGTITVVDDVAVSFIQHVQ